MAATYQQITLGDMKAALAGFSDLLKPVASGWKRLDEAQYKEYVYDLPITQYPGVVIRVYTSVSVATGETRGCGQDAIRVCAVDTLNSKGVMKTKRVHRTQNWIKNMRKRLAATVKHVGTIMERRIANGEYDLQAAIDTVSMAKAGATTVAEKPCSKCVGSGVYVRGGINHGTCFRCGGKGVATVADVKRCEAYFAIMAKKSQEDTALAPEDIPTTDEWDDWNEYDHPSNCDCETCLESRFAADYEYRMHGTTY